MKTSSLFLALLLGLMTLSATHLSAQRNTKHDLTNQTWSDGFSAYTVTRGAGGLLLFEGGTLHEGGSRFALQPQGGTYYRLKTYPGTGVEEITSLCEPCMPGNVVQLRNYGSRSYLIFYDNDRPVHILAPIDDLRKQIEYYIANYALSGEYRTKDGRTITFYPTDQGRRVKGLTDDGQAVSYTLGEEYHTPSNIVVLPDGSAFRVIPHTGRDANAIDIYTTTENEGEWSDQKVVVKNAHRTRYLPIKSSVKGDFPYTALAPMTLGELGYFSLHDLALMRNEIYARHGKRFHTANMKKHFESKSWYRAEAEEVTLTELDALNIDFIRYEEGRRPAE